MNMASNALIIVGLIGLITGGVLLIVNAIRKRFRHTWKRWTVITVCGITLLMVGVFIGSLPAELKITSLNVEPREVAPGESITITAIVENPGEAESIHDVVLVIDGVEIKSRSVALAPGERETISFITVENTLGTHNIELGQLVDTFQVVESAEFEITFFTMEPLEIMSGENVMITASVMNIGAKEGVYHAVLIFDGMEIETQSINLAPGEKQSISFTIVENVPGIHYVELGQIVDTLTVLESAEFVVGNIDITPNPVKVGEETTASINIENVGAGTGAFTTSLMIDGAVEQTKEATLEGGASTSVSFPITKESPGNYSIEIADQQASLSVVEPVRLNTGTFVVKEMSGGKAKLKVENGLDLDAVVALCLAKEPNIPLIVVYIRSDGSYTIGGIKGGTYVLYFAVGKDWDNEAKKFLTDASYELFDDEFKFISRSSKYSKWTVTLHPIVGGTAGTEPLSEDEFPGFE